MHARQCMILGCLPVDSMLLSETREVIRRGYSEDGGAPAMSGANSETQRPCRDASPLISDWLVSTVDVNGAIAFYRCDFDQRGCCTPTSHLVNVRHIASQPDDSTAAWRRQSSSCGAFSFAVTTPVSLAIVRTQCSSQAGEKPLSHHTVRRGNVLSAADAPLHAK